MNQQEGEVRGLMLVDAQAGDPGGVSHWGWLLGILLVSTVAVFVMLAVLLRRRWVVLRAARSAWKGARGPEGGPIRRIRAFPGLLRDAWRGTYPEVGRSRTLVWLVALLYLISPIDLIPELLPLLGIADDAGVGAWLLSTLYMETGHYVAQRVAVGPTTADRDTAT